MSQGATVQRERFCLLMAQSVWTEKTVHVWISAADAGWNQKRPLKPMMAVTTGQNNSICAQTIFAFHTEIKKREIIICWISCVSAPVRVGDSIAPDTPAQVRPVLSLCVFWQLYVMHKK